MVVNYCFFYGFCSQKTSYYTVFKQDRTCAMITTSLLTLMSVSLQQGGKSKRQLNTARERRDPLPGSHTQRIELSKKAQDETGNSISIVYELFV